MNTARSTPWKRYLPSGSTQDTQTLVAGLQSGATITSNMRFVPLDQFPTDGSGIFRGCEAMIFGTDANNETINYYLWRAVKVGGSDSKQPLLLDLCGNGVATLSTNAACTGLAPDITDTNLLTTSEYFADTLTWARSTTATTIRGPQEIFENTYGYSFTAQAYSPANDTPALLVVPDLGRCAGFVLEFDLGTAAKANAIYRLTR